jgi:uncharacterized Zn-finger protein
MDDNYEIYECSYCNKVFNNLANKNRHQSIHTQERRYKCKFCELVCTQSNNLKRHIKRQHPGKFVFNVKSYKNNCVELYALSDVASANIKDDGLHICSYPGCDKKFLTLGNLKRHVDIRH